VIDAGFTEPELNLFFSACGCKNVTYFNSFTDKTLDFVHAVLFVCVFMLPLFNVFHIVFLDFILVKTEVKGI